VTGIRKVITMRIQALGRVSLRQIAAPVAPSGTHIY
jgi:hypothetical protein